MSEQKIDDGGPAFPVQIEDFRDAEAHPMPGMSLRDYFAARVTVSEGEVRTIHARLFGTETIPTLEQWAVAEACARYRKADAMIRVRREGEP